MAFVIPEDVTFADIQKVIKKSAQGNLFKGSEIFDVYQGEHIKEGFKSVAFRIKMQDANATLTEDVIEKEIDVHSDTVIREVSAQRERVIDTETGRQLKEQISDLEKLLHAYRTGQILEKE